MSGWNIDTDQPEAEAMLTAREAATALGFAIGRESEGEFRAGKGNLPLSIFIGAFVAYCDFRVTTAPTPAGGTRIFIERNKPWWTGLIGLSRVAKQAKLLAEEMGQHLRDAGQTASVTEVK